MIVDESIFQQPLLEKMVIAFLRYLVNLDLF